MSGEKRREKRKGKSGGIGRYLSGIVETNLTGSHGGCFVEIGPGSVDYCDIIFFVACIHCSSA